MAVVFDAVSSASSAVATSLTFAHTCTGTDRAIGVGVILNATLVPTGVTYNGVALALEVSQEISSGGNFSRLYELENPASGANNVVVTIGAEVQLVCGAVSVVGADQTDCVSGNAVASGSSSSPSVTITSATGELVLAVICSGGVSWTAGTGETERWDLTNPAGGNSGWGGTEAGAASVTINPTQSASEIWGMCAMSFKASGAAPATEMKDMIGCGIVPFAR